MTTEANYNLLEDIEIEAAGEEGNEEISLLGREEAVFEPFNAQNGVIIEAQNNKNGESFEAEEKNENEIDEIEIAKELKRKAASQERTHKVFKFLFAAAVILLIAELIWLFVITPLRPFSVVNVNGLDFSLVDKNYLLSKAGINEAASYLFFETKKAEQAFSAIPLVESAKVEKLFPGTLNVNITQRRACALFLLDKGDKTSFAYIDKNGVVFMIGEGIPVEKYFKPLPVISGLETGNISLGTRLSSVFIPLFENLEKLSEKAPELLEGISEIEINKKTYDGFDITLYPSHSPVRIKMNKNLDEETIRYMFLLLDVLEAKNERVSEIDFRAGTASYFVK